MKNVFFWWSPHFPAFEPPDYNPVKKIHRYMQFQWPRTLLPSPETCPRVTWTQSSITNFLSLNPPQYESNHHKQDLLITTSKISHCFHQLQITKPQNFDLRSACNYEFNIAPHSIIFLTARRRSDESLPIPGVTQENLESIPPLCFLD